LQFSEATEAPRTDDDEICRLGDLKDGCGDASARHSSGDGCGQTAGVGRLERGGDDLVAAAARGPGSYARAVNISPAMYGSDHTLTASTAA
jgi:hypothetical protein